MFSTTTQEADSFPSASSTSAARNERLRGKRVAVVLFSFYPNDPRPRRALEAMAREGMLVDLICLRGEGSPVREVQGNVEVLRIPLKRHRGGMLVYLYQYAAFIFLSSVILAWRSLIRGYDLVHVHNMPDVLVISALVPKMLGAKVILDLHDPMAELMMTIFKLEKESWSVRLLRRIEKWSIARANVVVTVSVTFKRVFSGRSCAPEKVEVVMNSPDSDIFPLRAPTTPVYASPKPFVIMYHGSLVERNGLDLAVEALASVRETLPHAELRIYGESTPFLDRVMDMATSMGLQEAVHYLGPRRLEDLVAEIESCDVGVIPNHRNSFTDINTPTRIFEYLALGKPAIAPRTSGIQDYFDGESLIFFESGDAQDMARRIAYVFSHPAEVTEIVRQGQEVFREHSWPKERQHLIGVVSYLLDKGAKQADFTKEAIL
jgi:glycosyltransferase involved in cell wall biosynthesis